MKLTPEQVEALDVGTVVGRLADLKNLLFIMDSWMNSRGKVDELNREADCSKYDLLNPHIAQEPARLHTGQAFLLSNRR